MANNIKGITIEIGGNTTKLTSALSNVNKEVRGTQAELKEVEKLLKLDPKNTEALAQKQKLLKDAISETKEKLDVLKTAEAQVEEQFKRGEVSEEQYRALKREIEATELSLKNLESQAKESNVTLESVGQAFERVGDKATTIGNKLMPVTAGITALGGAGIAAAMDLDDGYDTIITKTGATGEALEELNEVAENLFTNLPIEMEDAGTAVGEINTRFGATGEVLEGLSEDFIKFANINGTDLNNSIGKVDKIMEQFNIDASETGNVLGLITQKGQATGISVDVLMDSVQKNGATFKEMGLNMIQAIDLLAQFEANGVNADTAIAGLRKSIKAYTDEGKSVDEALALTIDSIKNASSETEALSIAQEVFGTKGAAEMTTAIREGRIDLENLSSSMEEYGTIVSDTFEATQDPWDEAKIATNNLKLAAADLGGTLLSSLQPTITMVVGKVKEFTQWFRNLSDSQKQTIIKVAALVAAIGPAFIAFGKLSTGISNVIGVVTKLKGAMGAGGGLAKVLTMLTGPVGIVIGIIAALAAGFVALYKTNDEFREKVNAAVAKIKTAFSEMWQNIQPILTQLKQAFINLMSALRPIFEFILTYVMAVANGIIQAAEPIISAVKNAVDFITNIIKAATALFRGDFDGFFSYLGAALQNCIDFAKNIISAAVNFLVGFFAGFGIDIKAVFSGIWEWIVSVFSGVGQWFHDRFTEAYTNVTNVFAAIGQWFGARWQDIKNALAAVATWFLTMFTNAYTNVTNVFAAIGQWFGARWQDIKNALAAVATWFLTMFTNAYTNVTNVFAAIGAWFGQRWQDIKNALATVASWFLTTFTNAYTNVKNVFAAIGAWFGQRWQDVKNALAAVPSWFQTQFQNAWTNIKNVFSGVGSFFAGIWNTIQAQFTNIGKKVGDAIGGAFKSAMNSALSTVEKAVNKAIGFINGAIDVINTLPGVSVGHVGNVSLPRLARGGVLEEGQAIVAEAGPELLSMVNGKTIVTPLTGTARNTAMQAAGGGNGGYNQTINIYSPKPLSPYEIARQTRNQTQRMVLAIQRG